MTNRTIAEFVSQLNTLDVQVFIEDDRETSTEMRLRCTAPEGTLTDALRQELADRKAELISYLSQEKAEDRVQAHLLVSPPPLLSHFPLSFAQQRLWFLYQLTPDNPFYNVPAAIRLTGTLDQTALEQSFQEIVRRHAALRTTFATVDGKPVQVVASHGNVELAVVNLQPVAVPGSPTETLRDAPTETLRDRDHISQQLATIEAQRPFNLTTDPLLRVTLLRFDPRESVLLLTLHHIVADGWSLGVLIRELACCYTAFAEGRSPALPPLPMQYTDFACWQRNQLQGEVLETQLAYWRRQLHQLPVLQLPTDRPRPSVQTYRGATYPLQIAPTLTQGLEALSQQSGTSLFMTLLAAFQTLLYRYTGQEDIAIGAPIANRHRSELEGLIGFFVNSLVLRSDLSGNPTFRTVLERVRNVALEAYQHQDLPFEKLVEELDPDRDPSRNPLFQVAFALQNAPMQPLALPKLTLEPVPLESSSTRFDLEIHLWEPTHGLRSLWQSQEGLSGFIAYSTDLFDRDRIGRLIGHFQTLLEGIVAHPDAHLSDLPLLTAAERQKILVEWSGSPSTFLEEDQDWESDVPRVQEGLGKAEICFHHLFEAHVNAAPEAIALVTEQATLTYRELNQRAEQLAQTLRQMGVQPDDLVGLCVDRSADMVIGILGILKAGGAYVPLDPHYPSDRLRFMLTDTQVSILLTQSWLVPCLPSSPATVICLDHPLPLGLKSSKERISLTSHHLAYVIYTSGSTGRPKGALLSHRGLCNVVEAQQRVFHLSRHSRILQFSSLSFDASIFELALAVGSGGTLYIPPPSAQLPGMDLVQFLNDNAITHALLTPAVLAVLPPAPLPTLQVLITGGEACSSQVLDRWAANRHFFNAYGPTETTIWATVAELHPGDNPLTIGQPILNTQVYLLDASLNPVPVGIPGDLYIGGEGLARGYLNLPQLTAGRFIPNPFYEQGKEHPTPLLYKTGDRAHYRSDGTIAFLGRVDHQIKIRGFRVELGEIEVALQRHPAIREAVVIPSGNTASEMRLLAYFSLDEQQLQQTIRQSLQTQHIQHWQTLYNQTYQSLTPHTPHPTPQFNITGWNSSYTGKPIPLEQMQEWVSDRVQQILALQPKRVLEIGCGTGLLLFQLAPHCEKYVGTDFSKEALERIQQQVDSLKLPHVELLHCMATDFEGIDAASFDVVILNSIVQYFPSQDYLMQVLEGAMQAVATQGALFLGDVRSLPLLTAFHTWVQFCQAEAGVERTQLQQQVERSRFEEPELTIAPAFFHALPDRFPQIRQVQIRLTRGRSHNEMTQFRYNVLLHLESPETSKPSRLQESHAHTQSASRQTHDWKHHSITVEAIQKHLCENQPESLLITNVANSRVHAAVKTANWLANQEPPKTVGRMRDTLQNHTVQNNAVLPIDPQSWWDLETVVPYNVEITWSTQVHTGEYDVLLRRHGVDTTVASSISQPLTQSSPPYTNDPLQSTVARQLIPELRQSLKQALPDYMVPSTFVPLETLPLTSNGKVDRRALPALSVLAFSESALRSASTTIAPLTQTELTLIAIWQDLLRLKQVTVHDNFFDLGGHSLLATQMTSRVRDAFGLELPLQSVFETPTIAQLAPLVETLREMSSTPKVPPLVRLDRAAYRRSRSALPKNNLQTQPSQVSLPNDQVVVSDQAVTDQAATDQAVTVRSPLVPLTLGGSKQPFFCVHPMFGVVFPYLELAHQLGRDRSFYGLQPLGLDGKTTPLNRIEAIAAYYIQAMQTLQPHGPYFLGGWSFGGLVAFEMAQQLTQAGQPIALLAMLDTPAPTNHQPSFAQSLKFLLGTALWSTLPFVWDYGLLATKRLPSWNTWFSRWQWSTITRHLPEESRLQVMDEAAIAPLLRIVYANAQAAYRYVPQPYPDRITLFKAVEPSTVFGQNPTLGWSTLANDVRLHQVPGNHLSLLKHPHVQTLAQQLRPYLI